MDLEKGGHGMISEEAISRIRFFVGIAAENNSAVSVAELIKLLPDCSPLSANELSRALELQTPEFAAVEGFVTYRNRVDLVHESKLKMEYSKKRIEKVRHFVQAHNTLFRNALVVAVTGSTSYFSSEPTDDLDLLIVTHDGKLWVTLLSLLIYLRARKLFAPLLGNFPDYCLSLNFTKNGFRRFLEDSGNPLTARELINLRTVRGANLVAEAVSRCEWIVKYYPRIPLGQKADMDTNVGAHPAISERLTYALLASYLKFVASIRNFLFLANGVTERVFTVLENSEMLMYESIKYDSLKQRYIEFFHDEEPRKRYKHEYA